MPIGQPARVDDAPPEGAELDEAMLDDTPPELEVPMIAAVPPRVEIDASVLALATVPPLALVVASLAPPVDGPAEAVVSLGQNRPTTASSQAATPQSSAIPNRQLPSFIW